MNPDTIRKYCLDKEQVTEGFPFGEEALVFKVGGKIFLIAALDSSPFQFNVKCDPELAQEYRENYPAVIPAWHMNKKHWNTLIMDGTIPAKLVKTMIDDSYRLVLASLPAKIRAGFHSL
jgi:predicted DNA-binding protein (MmcQ/YjbR family)